MDMKDLIAKLTAIEENKVQDTGKAIKIQTSSHDDDDVNMHDEVDEAYGSYDDYDDSYDDARSAMYDDVNDIMYDAMKAYANGNHKEAERARQKAISMIGKNDYKFARQLNDFDFEDHIEQFIADNPDAINQDDDYDHDSLEQDDIDYINKNAQEESVMRESNEQSLDECGGEMTSIPSQQDNVSMTINMSGSGEGGIRDILNILNDIEHRTIQPDRNELPVGDKELNKDATMIIGTKSIEDRARETEEELANTPNPKYSTLKQITTGGGLNGAKGAYPRSQPGDNAMAVKQRLESLYNFVKTR